MSDLSSYSALTAKIHGMRGHLLTDDAFRELASCATIAEAVSYLKQHPFYSMLFADLDETILHREQLEQRLSQAIFFDFQKIYHFASQKQRHSLEILFQKYVPDLIRHCLYNINSGLTLQPQEAFTHPFFKKHAGLETAVLLSCNSVDALIEALAGTGYDIALKTVRDSASPTLFQYELALDMHYYSSVWKARTAYLSKKDLKLIEHSLGTTMDLLNIQWIFRCKKYFHMAPLSISTLLIPVQYKLGRSQLRMLVETATTDELLAALDNTYYGKIYRTYLPDTPEGTDMIHLQDLILDDICTSDMRKNPYSIAIVNTYIRQKETEISRIITAMEGIRYSLGTNEILRYLTNPIKEVSLHG